MRQDWKPKTLVKFGGDLDLRSQHIAKGVHGTETKTAAHCRVVLAWNQGAAIHPTGSAASQGRISASPLSAFLLLSSTTVFSAGFDDQHRLAFASGCLGDGNTKLRLTTRPSGKPARTTIHGKPRGKCHIGDQLVPTHFCLPAIGIVPRVQIALWLPNECKRSEARLHRSLAHRKSRGRQAATRMCRRPVIRIYQAPGCLVFLR